MATVLLVVIYIAFIALGIPDSLFGAVWPAIYPDFGLPVSSASFVTLTVSACTVTSSLLSARLINRFGTARITFFSTALTAAALLGFSISGNILWMMLFAVPLGLGAGAIDSALNNYIALNYSAVHMNFLHCFYGVGVSLSPYLMSLVLGGESGWRGGYRTMALIQTLITLICALSLPLWKKVNARENGGEEAPARTLSPGELVKMPGVRMVWLFFASSCAIEYTCGSWGSTYLVNARALPVDAAAGVVTFYYLGMTLGRFLSGLLSSRLTCWQIIRTGLLIMAAALGLLIAPLPLPFARAGLLLMGLGIGPLFPNMTHLTPQSFGRDVSQSIMGTQLAASYLGVMGVPPLFGLLAQAMGAGVFPYFLTVFFALLLTSTVLLIRVLKKDGRYGG